MTRKSITKILFAFCSGYVKRKSDIEETLFIPLLLVKQICVASVIKESGIVGWIYPYLCVCFSVEFLLDSAVAKIFPTYSYVCI
jgi:hypothetical protein